MRIFVAAILPQDNKFLLCMEKKMSELKQAFLQMKEAGESFLKRYPNPNVKVPAAELFLWHGLITNSCYISRKEFCKLAGIDRKTDEFTIYEFIELSIKWFEWWYSFAEGDDSAIHKTVLLEIKEYYESISITNN